MSIILKQNNINRPIKNLQKCLKGHKLKLPSATLNKESNPKPNRIKIKKIIIQLIFFKRSKYERFTEFRELLNIIYFYLLNIHFFSE